MKSSSGWDERLLSRVEDAGLNASAPRQQRWLDGWIVRTCPGKAKRARCINAVAPGRLPLDEKLGLCAPVYAEAGLPLLVRITPFSQPATLDTDLAARGFGVLDDTRVMVSAPLEAAVSTGRPLPPGVQMVRLDGRAFAECVGDLRGSPPAQRQAHGERLEQSPVPYRGYVLRRDDDGVVLACGQIAVEGRIVGVYDVFTREGARGQGLARALCERMLFEQASAGAEVAYLQVEADNMAARRIYLRLGFRDAYAYHYRVAPGAV